MSSNTLKKTLLKSHRATQTNNSAFSEQVSGNHYKTLKIQPLEYCMANGLNACQTHVVKYVSRYDRKWKDKKDQIKDLKKAKHVIDMQIELLEKE